MILNFLFLLISYYPQNVDTIGYEYFEFEEVGYYRESPDFVHPFSSNVPGVSTEQKFTSHTYKIGDQVETKKGFQFDIPYKLRSALIEGHKTLGPTMAGYRIQVFASSSLKDVNTAHSRFISAFPYMRSYRKFLQPTFRIRAGNFIDENEAQILCNQIRRYFPGAFVVPSTIATPSSGIGF